MTHRIFQITTLSLFVCASCAKDEQPSDDGDDGNDAGTDGDGDGDGTSDGEDGESTGSTGTTGTDDDASSFVPDEDIAGTNTCDPWAQDCPEGEKCVAYAMGDTWDSNKCAPIMGDGVSGDECTYDGALAGTDTCALGHMCYYTNMDGVGTCVPLCTGSADAPMCPDDFNCSVSNDGSLLLCLYSCNPLLQDCAQQETGCFWDGGLFNCDPAGDIPEGEPCGYINDCLAGQICLDAATLPVCNGASCCAAFCDIDDPVCLIADTECISFFDEGTAPPGLENVGICALPA